MSLKSFDLSYGFNGEPSSASLSFVYKTKTKDDSFTHQDIGALGKSAATSEPELNAAIKDFVVASKKTSKDAGFKSISYELVDARAKRLGSIAVLVRGITASPIGEPLKGMHRLFNAAEFVDEDVAPVGLQGDEDIKILANGQIVVIGRTFSVVSATVGDDAASVFYSRGKLVGQNPKDALDDPEMKEALRENIPSCSIRYGYFLKDFRNLLTRLGYGVEGFPEEDNFMILDFGGSLKDCVSSIASMFGLYWICRGSKITFYGSSSLQTLSVENFNDSEDSRILSSSYSEDVIGKSSVGVIVGTSSSQSNSQNFSFDQKNIKVTFLPIIIENMLGEDALFWVKSYLSLFRLSESFDFFDKMTILQMLEKDSKIKTNGLYLKYYKGEGLPENVKASSLDKLEGDSENILKLKKDFPFLDTLTSLYPMVGEHGSEIKLPSTTPIFSLVKAACMVFGSLYISKKITKRKAENYSVIAEDDFSVSAAYKSSTKLVDIPELAEFISLLRATLSETKENNEKSRFDERTLDDLYELVRDKKKKKGDSIISSENSYHYVGVKPLFKRGRHLEGEYPRQIKDAINAVEKGTKEGRGVFFSIGRAYLATSAEEITDVGNIFSTSRSLYNFLENSNAGKKAEFLEASKIKKEKNTDVEDADLSIFNSEWKSFLVRPQTDPFSDVSILKFEGNIGEAEYLNSKFDRLVGPSFAAKESSVTYDGIKIPSFSPVISSISVSFSEGSASTTVARSNKEFLSANEEVIMGGYSAYGGSDMRSMLIARQKIFLGIS